MPLLDLAQRQVGAETDTQGWLPVPVIEFVAAQRLRVLDLEGNGLGMRGLEAVCRALADASGAHGWNDPRAHLAMPAGALGDQGNLKLRFDTIYMQMAADELRYEDAAKLRDRIRELEELEQVCAARPTARPQFCANNCLPSNCRN